MTDIVWKIVVGGSGGVGKTTFLHRYATKQFLQDTKLTVGVSFQSHKLVRQEKSINLLLWDLGGQERFRFIQKPYIKGAVAAFLMYDMSQYDTLLDLKEWIYLIRETTYPSVPLILVGSKLDLVDPGDLPRIKEDTKQFAKNMNMMGSITISSKLGENIEESMEIMVDILLMQKTQGRLIESKAIIAT